MALLVFAGALFMVRGVDRAVRGGGDDLLLFYSATRVWLAGGNPYEPAAAQVQFIRAGGTDLTPGPAARGNEALLYPPTTFVLLVPLALLDWRAAKLAWLLLNLALFAASVVALVEMAEMRWRWRRTLLLIAGCLAFAPVHTSLAYGQTGLVGSALVILAEYARFKRQGTLAAIMLGTATALKPQLAGLFIVYELWRGRWRVAAGATATAAVVAAVGAGRLWLANVDWLPALRANVATFTTTGAGSPGSPYRYQLINLHYPLNELLGPGSLVDALVAAVAILVIVAYVLIDWRRLRTPGAGAELLPLGLIATVSLFAVYHRAYDACLLLIPLAWVLRTIATGRRRLEPWLIVILILPFFANAAPLLATLQARGMIPSEIAASAPWRALVMPQAAWALPILAATILYALHCSRRPEDH